MPIISTGTLGRLAEDVEAESVSSAADSLGRVSESEIGCIYPEKAKASRRVDPDYTDEMKELVFSWLMEDLDVTAEACHADPIDVFEDLLALIVSETPVLHRPDTDYAGAIRQVMDWFLEDVESVGRSFDLDPLVVLEDAFQVIVSETSLADRMIEAKAMHGTVFGEP